MPSSRFALLLAVAFATRAAAAPAPAAPAPAAKPQPRKTVSAKFSPAPLPPNEKAAWQHSPYAAGDCSICHERNDRKSPGKVTTAGNELCLGCHEEFAALLKAPHQHAPVQQSCVACHNPHDSRQRKLLYADVFTQCTACHTGIREVVDGAAVKHGAITTGRQCLGCHDPHASKVEKLLTALPYDQCVACHSQPGLKDDQGVALTNFKQLLADNGVVHAPVASKDCSACHEVHGGRNFRLLASEYPAKFYAAYDPKNYELCFGCHNDKIATDAQTTTLTNFRDGSRNLHFLHVNKADRGRTCRACHEVHASRQPHQIRDAVPYGPKGWMLKVNFQQTATGGQCAKTCHETKAYTNKGAQAAKK